MGLPLTYKMEHDTLKRPGSEHQDASETLSRRCFPLKGLLPLAFVASSFKAPLLQGSSRPRRCEEKSLTILLFEVTHQVAEKFPLMLPWRGSPAGEDLHRVEDIRPVRAHVKEDANRGSEFVVLLASQRRFIRALVGMRRTRSVLPSRTGSVGQLDQLFGCASCPAR